MTFLHKLIIGNRYLRYHPIWWWYRLMSHQGFRFDDYQIWGEFWHSLNSEWEHMEYVYKFEKFWGEGSYPPEKIILSKQNYDALVDRLNEPPDPKAIERLTEILRKPAPWDE